MISHHRSGMAHRPVRQQGVALIVALVVLVVIGLTSAAVMRGALSSDLVTNNVRVQSLANQAAQVALKYCEKQVGNPGGLPPDFNLRPKPVDPDDPKTKLDWETFGNWSNRDIVNDVPEAFMKSELSSFWPKMPQCIAQYTQFGGKDAIVITARGFSPDFKADPDTGATEAGSVVWLQYLLAVKI
jgi:type IV pilus assembly protein PilX